ncbi:methyl-accepting chemotaxis protein [Clostridium sp. CS001]|uniref:methyl-accepting chemotaxis protein n=1 Tax=Clostridium sp. CS001 TaxID=2880648 RepID=UPI001CF410F8|nr:methyl-accepting chemotaxis protein [Clostridium sp. CS001]MCB2290157.1 methyl-accepting chemotaxis protein [Clostridium sp. CS001]
MFNSIRKRLILNFALMAVVIILVSTSFATYQMITGIQNQMKYDGITLANNIKTDIENIGISNIDKIQSLVSEAYQHSEGNLYYIGVVSLDKILVAGTTKDAIGQKIDSAELDSVFKGNTASFMNEWQGTPAYNVTVPIKGDNAVVSSLSVGISVANMQKYITNGIKKSIIVGIFILIIAIIIGTILGRRIAKPIESIKNTVEKIGNGDLTVEYSVTSKDEIGRLATVSNETTKKLRELVRKIKSMSGSLHNLSQEVSNGGDRVSESSEEIAASVSSVSQEGIKQTEALDYAVKLLEDFSSDLNNVNIKLVKLAEGGEYIKKDINKGSERIKSLSNTIEGMQNSFDIVRNKVGNLDETISKINSIVYVINSVASQTNLLALNASIEAARAGEAGRGFSVVADEIRKLAEEVLTSSKNITELVNRVMQETQDVSGTTEIAAKSVEEIKEDVEVVITSFKDVIDKVNNIPKEINVVHEVLQGTMEGRDKILLTVESIAVNSQEISSTSEEATAATEEQAAITNEMAVTARKLVKMAVVLEKSVSSFNV